MDGMIHNERTDKGERVCLICGTGITYVSDEGYELWHKYENGYICHNCYMLKLRKDSTKIRNGKLSKHTTTGKGFIAEQVVSKYLGVDSCSLRLDNLCGSTDIFDNKKYGNIEVKSYRLKDMGRLCDGWRFKLVCKKVDTYFFLGFDKDRRNILRVWIIPSNKIKIKSVIVILNNYRSRCRYIEYEVDYNKFNDILHTLGKNGCKYFCDLNVGD